MAFSPDGTRIVSGGDDNTVRIWDAASGGPIGRPLTDHTGSVASVVFSPDGGRIVSGSADKTVRIWDAATGEPIGPPLTGELSNVWSVAISPDGKRIVSGGTSETLRWPGPTAWPELLCAKLTTNMSRRQWREWVSPDIRYTEVCPGLPIAAD